MFKKIKSNLIVLFFVLVIILSSCSNTSSNEKVLKVAIEKTFATLSSHATATLAEMEIIGQFMEGLVGYNESGKLVPVGAESYEVSADGLEYTFKLRQDVLWQNGETVTAQDYVYAWQQLIKDGAFKHNGEMFKNGKGILSENKSIEELGAKAVDDYTLVATLEKPDNAFLQYLSSVGFFPLHKDTFESTGGKDGYGTNAKTLMTNGPYELTDYVAGSKITLNKNEKYWDAQNVDIDVVEVNVISELTTQKVMFDNNELDYIRVQGELVDSFVDKSTQKTHADNRMLYMYLSSSIENDGNVLSNLNFRKAISLAFNREIITDSIVKDGSIPQYGLYPRNFINIDEKDYRDISGKYNENSFDITKAQEYLKTAQEELKMNEIKFKFVVQDMPLYKKVFENIKSQIETNLPGVTMEIETLPNQIFFPDIMKMTTPAAMATWGGGVIDFYNFAQLFESGATYNYGKYDNQEYDTKVTLARNELDPMKQAQLFAEAETLLVESAEFIPIYQMGQTYNLNTSIKQLIIQPSLPAVQYKYVKKV